MLAAGISSTRGVQLRRACARARTPRPSQNVLGRDCARASSRTFETEAFFTRDTMFRTRTVALRLHSRLERKSLSWQQVRHHQAGLTYHWTDKNLATSKRYPLTADLNRCMHPSLVEKRGHVYDNVKTKLGKRKTASSVVLRTQIVSPDLCGMSCLWRRQPSPHGR